MPYDIVVPQKRMFTALPFPRETSEGRMRTKIDRIIALVRVWLGHRDPEID